MTKQQPKDEDSVA